MTKNVKITFGELTEAYGNYRIVSRSPRNQNTVYQFCQFLGVDDEIWLKVYSHGSIPEEAAHKVKWLKGPNARTLYKAWGAKHVNKKG